VRPARRVRLERRGSLGWIVLDRPEAGNALTVEMRAQAVVALRRAAADETIAVVVVTGAGGNFCAGGDVSSMPEVEDVWQGRSRTATAQEVVRALLELEKPCIAAATGSVAGLGVSLFCACDIRLAEQGTRFLAAFPGVGLVPDGGLLYLLPRLIGWGRARDWMLLNRPLDAQEGLAWGLVTQVCPVGELEGAVEEVGARLAGLPSRAQALTKAGLRLAAESSWESTLEFERMAQGALIVDEEARARVRAFLDRSRHGL
jgi:enoyl-CoA hydratase/carnithine racemase